MIRRTFAIIAAICLLGSGWASAYAQSTTSRYFDETGHNVQGEFLVFYESNADALFLYGYPITEEFTSKDGQLVQYFQRARFEFHAEMPEGQRVQLSPLGQLTYETVNPLKINNTIACREYAETGHAICFAFLNFFDQNGGLLQFGYPISDFEYHENRIVQYFEKARIEWQPWNFEGQRVVTSNLGRVYFDQLGEDIGLLASVSSINNAPRVTTSLQVRAFVLKAVTLSTDAQSIFVIVQDQNNQPVSNANCSAVINWPGGEINSYSTTTNANGVGTIPLQFSNRPFGGMVYTDITCSHNGLGKATSTSFRIWY